MILDSDNIASHLRKKSLHNITYVEYLQLLAGKEKKNEVEKKDANLDFPIYTMTHLQKMELDKFMKVLDNILNIF